MDVLHLLWLNFPHIPSICLPFCIMFWEMSLGLSSRSLIWLLTLFIHHFTHSLLFFYSSSHIFQVPQTLWGPLKEPRRLLFCSSLFLFLEILSQRSLRLLIRIKRRCVSLMFLNYASSSELFLCELVFHVSPSLLCCRFSSCAFCPSLCNTHFCLLVWVGLGFFYSLSTWFFPQ